MIQSNIPLKEHHDQIKHDLEVVLRRQKITLYEELIRYLIKRRQNRIENKVFGVSILDYTATKQEYYTLASLLPTSKH